MVERATFTGFDSYRLTGVKVTDQDLGYGSYATVLELEYMGLKCAGKKIHEVLLRQGDDSYYVRRFEEECRLLSQIRHPNIVQFLGVYFQQGVRAPILVMEFLPTNLTSCIEQYGILPKEISYSILHDVALGLCYLHSQTPPIIHRDLSSNNVLLTLNMTAKISDLGVARILNLTPLQASQITPAPGTPAFMPPEVMVANPKYDTSVDVFSYGIIMIHMFSSGWPEPQVGSNRTEPDGRMIPVSEAERREVFLQAIGNDHPLMGLIVKCIYNVPQSRACIDTILKETLDLKTKLPASFANQIEILKKIEDQVQQIERFKEEVEQKANEIDQLNIIHSTEMKQLQLQIQSLNSQTKQDKAKSEAQIAELNDNALRERKELQEILADKRATIMELEKKIGVLQERFSNTIAVHGETVSTKDKIIKTKTLEIEANIGALDEKNHMISEMSCTITEAIKYISNKQQVLLASFTWTPCAKLPTEFKYGKTTVINGKVYYGGAGKSDIEDTKYVIYCYDPSLDKWTTLPPLPVKRFGLGHVDGKLVAVGGMLKNHKVAQEIYTYHNQRWESTIPPMPTARSSPDVLSLQSALVVAGGFKLGGALLSYSQKSLKSVEIFRHDTSQWYKSDQLPSACRDISLFSIGNTCYALGGFKDEMAPRKCGFYISVDDLLGNAIPANGANQTTHSDIQSAWKTLPDTPTYRPAAAMLAGNLLAVGGTDEADKTIKQEIYMHVTVTNSWIYVGALPSQYFCTTVAVLSPFEILAIAGSSVHKGTPMVFKIND